MICKICSTDVKLAFKHEMLSKYSISYYKCSNCGYLFTEDPYWISEAYSSAIANADTGILQRNFYFKQKIPLLLYALGFNLKLDNFLDYAGGGGIFVRLMRDIGLNYTWYDKYCANWVANGFEADLNQKFAALTTFESFEHFEHPMREIDTLFHYTNTIIFSTELLQSKIPNSSWWYYSFETGQHIGFYEINTLEEIAHLTNSYSYSFGSIHILSKIKISAWRLSVIKFIMKSNYTGKILSGYLFRSLESKTVSDMNLIKHTPKNRAEIE